MAIITISITSFKCYEKTKKFTFSVGELFHLTGPSGSGKSTILSAFEWGLFSPSNTNVKPKGKKGGSPEVIIFFEDKKINIHRTLHELKVTLPSGKILTEDAGQGYLYSVFGDRNTWASTSLIFNGGRNLLLTGSGEEKLKILRNIAYGYELEEKDNPNFYLEILSNQIRILSNELKIDRAVYSNLYDEIEKELKFFEKNLWEEDDRYKTIEEAKEHIRNLEKEIKKRTSLFNQKESLVKTLDSFLDDKKELQSLLDKEDITDKQKILSEIEDELQYLAKLENEIYLAEKSERFLFLSDKISSSESNVEKWKKNGKYSSLQELEKNIFALEKEEKLHEYQKQEILFLKKEILSLQQEEDDILDQIDDIIPPQEEDFIENQIKDLVFREKKALLHLRAKKEFPIAEINPSKLLEEEDKKNKRMLWEKEGLTLEIPIIPGLLENMKDVLLERELQSERKNRLYFDEMEKYYDEIEKEIVIIKEKKKISDEFFSSFTEKLYNEILPLFPDSLKNNKKFMLDFFSLVKNFLLKEKKSLCPEEYDLDVQLEKALFSFSQKEEDLLSIKNSFRMDEKQYKLLLQNKREKPLLPDHKITPEFVLKVEKFYSKEPPCHDKNLYEKLKQGKDVLSLFERENINFSSDEKDNIDDLRLKIKHLMKVLEKNKALDKKIKENQSKILYIRNKKDEAAKILSSKEKTYKESSDYFSSLCEKIKDLKNLQKDYFLFLQTETEQHELMSIKKDLIQANWDFSKKKESSSLSLETIKKRQDEENKKIKLIQEKISEEKKIKEKISYLSSKINDLEKEIEKFSSIDTNTDFLIEELEEHQKLCVDYFKYDLLQKRVNDVQIRKEELEKKEKIYETHDRLFEIIKKVSMEPIEDLIHTLNFKVNNLLEFLFEEPIRLLFSLYRTSNNQINKIVVNLQIYHGENNHTTISTLSNGEADRISIALSLVMNSLTDSPILFLDECMSTLETEVREKCLNTIRKFSIRQGKCVVDICHESVEGYHDKIINVN